MQDTDQTRAQATAEIRPLEWIHPSPLVLLFSVAASQIVSQQLRARGPRLRWADHRVAMAPVQPRLSAGENVSIRARPEGLRVFDAESEARVQSSR